MASRVTSIATRREHDAAFASSLAPHVRDTLDDAKRDTRASSRDDDGPRRIAGDRADPVLATSELVRGDLGTEEPEQRAANRRRS
jgi:hypothetical protein